MTMEDGTGSAPADMRIVSESSPTRRLVASRLTDAIVQGMFRPGERLIERELCEMLGVSRTSVREALRELESEGLIENIPHRGIVVTRLTPESMRSIYEVRAALEGLAARLFAERATAAQVQRLAAAVDAVGEVYADFSAAGFLREKGRFYDVLLEGAGNDVIAQVLRSIHVRASRLRVLSLQNPRRADASLKELRRLIACIRKRDADGAQRECIRHVDAAATAALLRAHEPATTADVAPA